MAEENPIGLEPPQDDPLESQYDAQIKQRKKTVPMRVSFDAASQVKPDQAGEIIKLANKTKLDRDTVKGDLENIQKTAAQPTDKEYQQLLQTSPKTSKWLEDPYNAAATANDRAHLQKLERSLSQSDPLARVRTDEEVVKHAEVTTQQRYDDLVAEEGKTYYREDAGPQTMLTRTPEQRAKLKLNLLTEEIAKQREQEKFIASKDKITAGETFGQQPLAAAPFLSTIFTYMAADEKAMREARMSPEDMDALIQQKRIEAAAARRGTTWQSKLLSSVSELTSFIGEMMVGGEAAEGISIGKGLLGKFLTKGAQIGTQTAFSQFPKIAENTLVYGTPETSVTKDDNGELQIKIVDGQKQTYVLPFVKAVASSLVDVSAANLPFHPAFKFWAKNAANPTVEGFAKAYLKGGAESLVGFMAINDATKLAKELAGLSGPVEMPDTLKAIGGDKEAIERVLVSAGVGLAAGVGGTALQRRRAQADVIHGQAMSYKDWFHEMSDTVKDMESHGKHPEVVADAIKGMVENTDREFTKVRADTFFDHYSKLGIDPQEYAAELTGNPVALQEALQHDGKMWIPTDQYLTKIGATDAGPVFEKSGVGFDPNIPSVDEAKQHIQDLIKEQEAAREKKTLPPDQLKLQDQIKALGEDFKARAKEQGINLAQSIEKSDTVKAKKITGELAAATESLEAAKESLGQSRAMLADQIMEPKAAEAYNKLIKDSREAAYTSLDADALEGVNKERKQQRDFIEGQVRDGLKKEVERQPEYQAQSIMETGLDADGNIVHEGGIKLDREAIKAIYGEETLKALPKKSVATSKESGASPDVVSQLLGFSSGDELIQKLSNLENIESVIDRRTNEIMAKVRLDELIGLPEKAKEAIHNDQEAKVKAYQIKWLLENRLPQMKALLKRVSNSKEYIEEIRKQADAFIASKSDRLNHPSTYEAAERQANRNAKEALLSDIEKAPEYMELELLNHELYRASLEAQKDARRIREYANEFNKADKRKLMYAAGTQYLAQSDALMDRFSLKNVSGAKLEALESLKEFAEKQADEGYILQIPEKLLRESYKQNWRDVPLEDLRGIEATLKQLENNAKLKTSILEANEKKSRDAIASELGGQIRSSKKAVDKPVDSYTKVQEFWRGVKNLFLSGRADADIYREMDHGKDGGPLQQHISRRMNESATKEAQLNERAMYALDGIYKKFSVPERFSMNREKFIPEINGSLSAWQRMEIAAILGQKGAKQRFLDGRGWGEAQLKAITDGFTEKQWNWVKDVHEFLGTYAPEVKEQIERRTGLPAKMVEAEPIETPFGKQDGGYFPFKYDARVDPQTGKTLDMDEARRALQSAGVQAQTRHGFTEQRVDNVKDKRLRFDAGVLFEHIREVTHDLAWSETLRDVSSLLRHKDVAGAINDHYGDQVYRQLTNSLHDIAVGDTGPQKAYDRYVNALRRGTTTASLGLSFMQAATDPVGISQGTARIGPKWMGVGMQKVLGDAVHMENAYKEMMDVSEQQRLRSKTFNREINEVRNKIEKQGTLAMLADMGLEAVTGGKVDVQDLHNGFYYMMTKVQIAQEGPLWWGALEKAKSEKPLPTDATPEQAKKQHDTWVSMADQAVLDTYGGGQIKDLAPIQKGGSLQKLLFSTFYSFASRTYNLAVNSGMKTMRGQQSFGRLIGDMALLYGLPSLATFAIKNALTQNDKDLPQRLVQDEFGYMAGSVPYVRELAGPLRGQEYQSPAGLRLLVALGKFGKSAWEGKADWRDLNSASGILFHYPALQVERFVRGMESWLDTGKGTPLSPLFGPPPKKR